MSSFRFVHSGDLHLGFPFERLPGCSAEEARRRKKLHFAALDHLISGTIQAGADFILFAGDIFDRNSHDLESRICFIDAMKRLQTYRIPVRIVAGNHDPWPEWSDIFTFFPENVRLFGTQAESEVISIHGQPVAEIAGASHADRRECRNLAMEAAEKLHHPELFRIVLVHANVGHTAYSAPVSPDDLKHGEADYWALGHMHNRSVLQEKPMALYCGNLYRLDRAGNEHYGINLVTVSNNQAQCKLLPRTL